MHVFSSGDKSRKGSVDERVHSLVELINGQQQVYTTSSCSGRISVFGDPTEVRAVDYLTRSSHVCTWRAPATANNPQLISHSMAFL